MHADILTPPAGPVLDLEEARAFLRLSGPQDDLVVAGLVAAAEARVEAETGLALMPRRLRGRVAFTRQMLAGPGLRFRPGPVQQVEAISLVGGSDLSGMLHWSDHRLRLADRSAAAALPGRGELELTWQAGFPEPPGVPADLRFAVSRLVAEGYARRGLSGETGEVAGLPGDVAVILAHYTEVRL